ncbi:MAG: hypothetical protein ACR2NZ_03890 [Rubripirellula sp.]
MNRMSFIAVGIGIGIAFSMPATAQQNEGPSADGSQEASATEAPQPAASNGFPKTTQFTPITDGSQPKPAAPKTGKADPPAQEKAKPRFPPGGFTADVFPTPTLQEDAEQANAQAMNRQRNQAQRFVPNPNQPPVYLPNYTPNRPYGVPYGYGYGYGYGYPAYGWGNRWNRWGQGGWGYGVLRPGAGGAPAGGSNYFGNPHGSHYFGNPHGSQSLGR